MLKRGGRSYDPTGIEGTSPGELAVLCPACPIPSVNLPPNWQSVGKDSEYVNPLCVRLPSLMSSILGISTTRPLGLMPVFDLRGGRFRAMRRTRSWGLGLHTSLHGTRTVSTSGASPTKKRFVASILIPPHPALIDGCDKQMSTCSGLSALDHANSKHTKGYATSGIVCTTCRHEFILPEGAGPLQKGERFVFNHMPCIYVTKFPRRYANTDYVVVRSTSHNPGTKKVASYDIMCQWSVNLRTRLKDFPLVNAERLDDQIVARLVPKFHLAAHKEGCRINFSLNYEPGVGRSDMEGPERTWSGLQGGGSTKDQGPGYWSDAMDDKFGHWNWSKLVRLGRAIPSSPDTIT